MDQGIIVKDDRMNSEWMAFLGELGGRRDDRGFTVFGSTESKNIQLDKESFLCDLSHLSWIHATGVDASSFLHGQLTNDLETLPASRSQLSAYCNPKGRMLCLFRISRHRDGFLLQLPGELSAAVLKRLTMYVLRAKVTLQSLDQELASLGVHGTAAAELLARQLGPLPPGPDGVATDPNGIQVLALPGIDQARYQVVAPATQLKEIWRALASRIPTVAGWSWSWLDIVTGIPQIWSATSEEFIPQMANLDLIGGVSFKKGCYPGQEIVARMHYLGRLKQRMIRAHVEAYAQPGPADRLYAGEGSAQSAGTLVDAHPAPDGGFDLLAVVQLAALTEGELHLGASDGPTLERCGLPYSLDSPRQRQD